MESYDAQVKRLLEQTDWGLYGRSVSWRVRKPDCPLYDGNHLCDAWKGWMILGRELYPGNEDGEKQFIEKIRVETGYRLGNEDIRVILGEIEESKLVGMSI
jgi:hypothetical protein